MLDGARKEESSNSMLLDGFELDEKYDSSLDLVSAIGANRPFKSANEASASTLAVNNVMYFIEYGLSEYENLPNEEEKVFLGLKEILRATRLVSLRVEQYLDSI